MNSVEKAMIVTGRLKILYRAGLGGQIFKRILPAIGIMPISKSTDSSQPTSRICGAISTRKN
jgi:hypothetical protein